MLDLAVEVHCERAFHTHIKILLNDEENVVVQVLEGKFQLWVLAQPCSFVARREMRCHVQGPGSVLLSRVVQGADAAPVTGNVRRGGAQRLSDAPGSNARICRGRRSRAAHCVCDMPSNTIPRVGSAVCWP